VVRRWQARQIAPDRLRVLLVPSGEWNDGSLEAIGESFRAKLGDSLTVDLVLVSDIPLAPNGKMQTIVPLDLLTPITSAGSEADWQSPSEGAGFS